MHLKQISSLKYWASPINNPKSIAEKVMEYINNPELTEKIIRNAKEMVVQQYDWDLIAKEMKAKVFDKV